MTSRERMLAAMRREGVDRVPVPQTFWRADPKEQAFSWDSLEQRIAWKKEHGFDEYLWLPVPTEGNPDIEHRSWMEDDPNEPYPIMCSEWRSARGTLTARLRKTDDYCGDRIGYFGDFNTARYTRPLLAGAEDMMTFVAMDPFRTMSGEGLRRWRQACEELRGIARREGLATCCNAGSALDYLIQGSTAEQAIMLLLDYPEETMAFLKYLNEVSTKAMELCIETGVDFVIRRGWYESTDFWSPQHFARFAAPFIRNTVRISHQAGLPCCYLMCTGIVPLLPQLAELDFDCLMGVEPVCTGQDIQRIVGDLGESKSFWTGLSAPLHIGRGSAAEVRHAVREAFDTFGREGFLLSAVPSIRRHWPWENVEAMTDEYRKITGSVRCYSAK